MSRYFQQLARHAGMSETPSPLASGLRHTGETFSRGQDLSEEMVERDILPMNQPSPATSPEEFSLGHDLQPSLLNAPSDLTAALQPAASSIVHPQSEKNVLSRQKQTSTEVAPSADPIQPAASTSRPTEIAKPILKNAPDVSEPVSSVQILQEVMNWIAEPERAAARKSSIEPSPLPAAEFEKNPESQIKPESISPVINILKPVTPAQISKSPVFQAAPAVKTLAKAQPVANTENAKSGRFDVTIESLHVTIEAPPQARANTVEIAPKSNPPAPVSSPARSGGLSTRVRRHYLPTS